MHCKSYQLAYNKPTPISLRSLHKAGSCIGFAIFDGNADDETMAVKWVSKFLVAQLVCAGAVPATNSEDKVMFCQCHLSLVLCGAGTAQRCNDYGIQHLNYAHCTQYCAHTCAWQDLQYTGPTVRKCC